jgi:hypothetical protein
VFRARVPHPEFGYADTSNYSFFSTFMAFVVCGVVAGATSIAIFNSEPGHDPMDAMALAPAEALIAPKPAQLATQVGRVRPPRAMNEQPLIATVPIGHRDDLTVPPASPPAPIAVSPLPGAPLEEPKTAPARTETSVREETSLGAASAAVTPPAAMPTVTSEKPQQRVHRASRRHNQYSYTSSYGARRYNVSRTYSQGGYARLSGFW